MGVSGKVHIHLGPLTWICVRATSSNNKPFESKKNKAKVAYKKTWQPRAVLECELCDYMQSGCGNLAPSGTAGEGACAKHSGSWSRPSTSLPATSHYINLNYHETGTKHKNDTWNVFVKFETSWKLSRIAERVKCPFKNNLCVNYLWFCLCFTNHSFFFSVNLVVWRLKK